MEKLKKEIFMFFKFGSWFYVQTDDWGWQTIFKWLFISFQQLFQGIHSSFKKHLQKKLLKLGVTNDGGPQHG